MDPVMGSPGLWFFLTFGIGVVGVGVVIVGLLSLLEVSARVGISIAVAGLVVLGTAITVGHAWDYRSYEDENFICQEDAEKGMCFDKRTGKMTCRYTDDYRAEGCIDRSAR